MQLEAHPHCKLSYKKIVFQATDRSFILRPHFLQQEDRSHGHPKHKPSASLPRRSPYSPAPCRIWNPAGGGRSVACPLERRTPLPHHRQGQRILSARGRGHALGRGCPISRRGHRREDAGVYDRYGSRSAAQSQRTGWRLPYPR